MAVTANPSASGALLYADESSFDESSTTFDERLPVINPINEMTAGLQQGTVESTRTLQYQNDDRHGFKGVQRASFPIELWMTGHGSATTGAISATDLATFLGRCIGNSSAASAGGTVTGTPTDADTFSLTGHTFADGALCRIGSIGDSRGEGQFYRLDDPDTPSDPIVLNALAGTPNASDVVYAPELVYPNESPTSTAPTSMRFQMQTANQRYNVNGAWCSGLELIDWSPGRTPRVRANMSAARWTEESSSTFPTTTSTDAFAAAPVAGGSFFLQAVGTTTRATYDIRDFQANINIETVPVLGPGSGNSHVDIIGVRRGKCMLSFTVTLDAETAGTQTFADIWNTSANSRSYYHVMYTLSAEDGTAVGLYCPKVMITGTRPVQSDIDGLNRIQVSFRAVTGGTSDTALEQASFVIGIG